MTELSVVTGHSRKERLVNMGQHANFTQERPDWPWLCKNPERPRCKVKLRERRLMWLSRIIHHANLPSQYGNYNQLVIRKRSLKWTHDRSNCLDKIVYFCKTPNAVDILFFFFMLLVPDEHTKYQAIILREQKQENKSNSDTANLFEERLCSRCWGSGLFTALVRINKTQYQYNDSPSVWLFSGKGLWDKGPQSAASDRRRQRVSCVPTHKVQAAEGVNRCYSSSAVRLPRHLSRDVALHPGLPSHKFSHRDEITHARREREGGDNNSVSQTFSHSLTAVKVILLRNPSQLSLPFVFHASCMFSRLFLHCHVSPTSQLSPLLLKLTQTPGAPVGLTHWEVETHHLLSLWFELFYSFFWIVFSMRVDCVGLCLFVCFFPRIQWTKVEAKRRAVVPRSNTFIHFIHSACCVHWRAFTESFIYVLTVAPIALSASKAHLKWKEGEEKKTHDPCLV